MRVRWGKTCGTQTHRQVNYRRRKCPSGLQGTILGHLKGGGEVAVLVDWESRPVVEVVDQCVPVRFWISCISNLKKNTKYAEKRRVLLPLLQSSTKTHVCKNEEI